MAAQITAKRQPPAKKRRNVNKIRLMVDLGFLIVVVIVILPQLTGITIHEWGGVLIVVPLLVHLVLDWRWIVATTGRIFKAQANETRFNYILNWVQFIVFLLALVSGLMISETLLPVFGIHIQVDRYWITIHEISAGVFTVLLGVHIAMHWRWIVSVTRRYLLAR